MPAVSFIKLSRLWAYDSFYYAGEELTSNDLKFIEDHTKFSPDSIKKWFKKFRVECPNGRLTKTHMGSYVHIENTKKTIQNLNEHMYEINLTVTTLLLKLMLHSSLYAEWDNFIIMSTYKILLL